MANLGPFCQSIGLTKATIQEGSLPPLDSISNGLALELKSYCDTNNLTVQQFINILAKLNKEFCSVNPKSIVSKVNCLKDQKKSLSSKKKVKGYKNLKELLETNFKAPVTQLCDALPESPDNDGTSEMETKWKPVLTSVNNYSQTDTEYVSDYVKKLNELKYTIKTYRRTTDRLSREISDKQDQLNKLKSNIGHYSVKNVNKRDETARKNLHKLRNIQRTVMKQEKLLAKQNDTETYSTDMKIEMCTLKENVKCLNASLVAEKAKKVSLQKTNSYLKNAAKRLRSIANDTSKCDCLLTHVECDETLKRKELEIDEQTALILEMKETIQELMKEKLSINTKTEKGAYTDNVRLCIMELAGLEVAVEKVSPIISAVLKHLTGTELSKDQLPNPTTAQTIVDEGHFIAKVFIADKLENCENWGLCRDGTTRKKQKILDTSVTLDSGDVISLGFTRVAQETAQTIQNVTEDHLNELTELSGKQDYICETLRKLAFTMSDRASNEKCANKLLDDWLERMLINDNDDVKLEVQHFHCMAHVLLGFHSYINPDLKDFEQTLKDESGPLGRDALSVFNMWSKKEPVVSRVIRTTSDTFGPAGDHLGVRDRWEAYCREHGIKSMIGNYRDNRFNALFQTSAEVFTHRTDFIKVLDTVSKPNLKLTAVKSDLECTEVSALLQCLGLFYIKVTGPYWNLITCGDVPYFELYKHVCDIEQFLNNCVNTPDVILKEDEHWSPSESLDVGLVPHHRLLARALFTLHEDTQGLVMRVVPIVATAMLKCIRKQLVDFLPGGKFNRSESNSTKYTNFAPVTSLGCEHHFGDVDSSQRRRPHASYHHHTSVQLLKRNRQHVMNWVERMDNKKRQHLLKTARKEGIRLRAKHRENDQKVLEYISKGMSSEKESKGKKRTKVRKNVSVKKQKTEPEATVISVKQLNVNEYVAVAYQDGWYPGYVEQLVRENEAFIRFMVPCRKQGYFQWPMREDKQLVDKQFVLSQTFVPDCCSSGRQWFVKEHVDIDKEYSRFHATYFS